MSGMTDHSNGRSDATSFCLRSGNDRGAIVEEPTLPEHAAARKIQR
jgi:hypothetical protein